MRRREFIAGLGGAVAWPLAALAQQPALPVVGFMNTGAPAGRSELIAAFWRGVNESGYVENRNVAIAYRWAEDNLERMPAQADDLVRRRVSVIVTGTSTLAVRATQAATKTIPIVFISGADPIQDGLVANLNRPGGNATGVHYLSAIVAEKRLGLLHDLAPAANRIGILVNPNQYSSISAAASIEQLQSAASVLGLKTEIFHAGNGAEIDAAFAALRQARTDALLIVADTMFFSAREQIATLATRLRIPAIFTSREYADVGGLMSYGTSLADAYHKAGVYAGRILKGEKPSDLPVVQSERFEFVINLKTAKDLGLAIPPGLLAIADGVIE
jgi:putative ABC transport system substrate-binding protein